MKVHASVEALGNPLRFTLTAGQELHIAHANSLTEGIESDYVIAARGYDSRKFESA